MENMSQSHTAQDKSHMDWRENGCRSSAGTEHSLETEHNEQTGKGS